MGGGGSKNKEIVNQTVAEKAMAAQRQKEQEEQAIRDKAQQERDDAQQRQIQAAQQARQQMLQHEQKEREKAEYQKQKQEESRQAQQMQQPAALPIGQHQPSPAARPDERNMQRNFISDQKTNEPRTLQRSTANEALHSPSPIHAKPKIMQADFGKLKYKKNEIYVNQSFGKIEVNRQQQQVPIPGYEQGTEGDDGEEIDESEESESDENDYNPEKQAVKAFQEQQAFQLYKFQGKKFKEVKAQVGVVNYGMTSPRVVNPDMNASGKFNASGNGTFRSGMMGPGGDDRECDQEAGRQIDMSALHELLA